MSPAGLAAAVPESTIRVVQSEVLDWFAAHGRDLPWRNTRDPHPILVSEIMLQQTQVSRVLPYYERFLETFPTVETLATAPTADVLRAWQGLGYNRRALYLSAAARDVMTKHDGAFPATVEGLQTLTGVGRYTARAVACFAFDVQVAVVETNVRKVLRYVRETGALEPELSDDALAETLLPATNAWTWNQAMIDFGAIGPAAGFAAKTIVKPTASFRVPFELTDRYWRGRIVAALCSYREPISTGLLLRELPEPQDEYRVRGLLTDMHTEGLVHVNDDADTVSLPG